MLYNIIVAYVYSLGTLVVKKDCYEKEAVFVFVQLNNLPWYFRVVIIILICLLNYFFLTDMLRPFHNLSSEMRLKKIHLFKKYAIGPFKDLYKFLDNLTLFAVLSYEEI